ncbi:Aldo/keto reductase [Suillus paluster]|uniref:Aldo/keto reductase n=1 Tax=Suillus paluster TaxID=48578 RepID=UPI001B86478F|nr:Aldo/keto reductase [Suillus paluster]KAG1752471.1 Aldo/keto reductase [Suillus paluster]
MALSLQSVTQLLSGGTIPVIGLGVYLNDECAEACQAALEEGYRMIDSARYYMNEAQVGVGVRRSGIPREQIFITSKIYHPDFGYARAYECIQESVVELGLGYYDLYLIHSPTSGKKRRIETYRALLEAKKDGLVRKIGVSNYSGKHIDEIIDAGLELPDVNQIELHPFCQQRPIVEYCRAKGIAVQAYSPLVTGQMDHNVFTRLAKKHDKDEAQILIRWSLQKGSNAQVFNFELDKDDMDALDALDQGEEGAVTWNPVNEP